MSLPESDDLGERVIANDLASVHVFVHRRLQRHIQWFNLPNAGNEESGIFRRELQNLALLVLNFRCNLSRVATGLFQIGKDFPASFAILIPSHGVCLVSTRRARVDRDRDVPNFF